VGDDELRTLAADLGLGKDQTTDLEDWLADWQQLYLRPGPNMRDAARTQRQALMTLRNALADALKVARVAGPALRAGYLSKRMLGDPGIVLSTGMQLSSDLRAVRRLGRNAKAALGKVRHSQGRKSTEDLVEAVHALIEKLADLRMANKKDLLRGLRSYKGRGEQLERLLMHALRRIAPDLRDSTLNSAIKRAATVARKTA